MEKKREHSMKKVRQSLLRAAQYSAIISLQEIKAAVQKDYHNPVISLYMRLNAGKVVPKEKGLVRSFHSLKKLALEHRRDFIDTLSKAQKEVLTRDIDELETFLTDYFVPAGVRSLIIFKSGEELNRIIRLPVQTADNLIIDSDPYILPLELALEENEKLLFAEITKEESRFLIYHLGYSEEVDKLKSFVPTDSVDKSIPGRVQRHRLNHLQKHLKETAQRAYSLFRGRSCEALVLMGENRVLHLLEDFLHNDIREKIISRIYNSPAADTRDRKELIQNVLRDHKAEREEKAIDDLGRFKPGDELVPGLREVVAVSNLLLVRKLLVSAGIQQNGFICKGHHYVSIEESDCPFCSTKLIPVENVVDEIVEVLRNHGAEILIVEYRQELLANYGGIVALLHYPLGKASLRATRTIEGRSMRSPSL
jgi:hypothetical protein